MQKTGLIKAIRRIQTAKKKYLHYFLARYMRPFAAKAKVWGSSVIELNPILDANSVSRARVVFRRKFKKCKILARGRSLVPNGIQLSLLRPQLAGGDILITAPPKSGKTLAYLLPEVMKHSYIKHKNGNIPIGKTLVLVPTLDLVLLGSRSASGALRQVANVQPLYYKDLLHKTDLADILRADVIYSTPSTALKALLAHPSSFGNVQSLILDEAHKLLSREFAISIVRIRNLLNPEHQTIALAPRNEPALRQFMSRFMRVNFRIISFCPDFSDVPITKQIWGPQRSNLMSLGVDGPKPGSLPDAEERNTLEMHVQRNRLKVLEHCKLRDVYVHKDLKCDYAIYEPMNFAKVLQRAISQAKKKVVFFPTVRMAQFCYIYFKYSVGLDGLFYALHSGLSPEKRCFVIDNFTSCEKGLLFATDLASVGLNMGDIDLVVQVGAAPSMDVFSDRICHCIDSKSDSRCLLLLHDLDAHVLYEASKFNCDIKPSCIDVSSVHTPKEHARWIDFPQFRASCELMYRSILGYHCNNAKRLKFERWQVPSLANELLRSFGFTDTFYVSKQFAARLKITDSPGLSVRYDSTQKSWLQAVAAAAAYPGFHSRIAQNPASDTLGSIIDY